MSHSISVRELKKILDTDKPANTILIDVRTAPEHKATHIKGAVNIPLNELEARKAELEKYDTIFLHCRSGGRSRSACNVLSDIKSNIVNVEGGILEWQSEGFAVEKGKSFYLPLIQQVHILAGALVSLGAILALTINPQWVILSLFIGLGLVFAGITGWCGMAKMLELMPWNK